MKLEGVDPICVVIGRTRHKMILLEMQEAARQGAGLIELRLDFLAKAPDFTRLLDERPCPIIATVRRPADGGRWSGTEDARRTLLRQAIVAGFDWVDLESEIADAIPRFGKVRRIISYHNVREMPPDLEVIHEKMCKQDADVVKLAVRAQNPADNLRVLKLCADTRKPTIAHCMGDIGIPSRILAAKFGAPFTYAAFNKERGIAPGIVSFAEMRKVYHYHQINEETEVFGVIGDPVAHSLSPLIHNQAFRKLGLNAVYVPFRVTRSDFPVVIRLFDKLPVQGYSVTIPHKEAAAALADRCDKAATETHAANTLLREQDASLSAYNTDYQGFLDALLAYLPPLHAGQPSTLASRTVLVLGAGGIARAVAHSLHANGALVTIVNRTPERAHKLAAEVGCRYQDWESRHSVLCDVVVNCTPVGMHPSVDDTPVHPSLFKPSMTVFDTVYTPENTLLVKQARERGCHVVTGVELFIRQAALQFELFTGRDAPVEFISQVARRALSPVAIREEPSSE